MKKHLFILNLLKQIYFALKIIKFLKFSFAGSNSETNFYQVSGGFKTYWVVMNSGYFKVSENLNA